METFKAEERAIRDILGRNQVKYTIPRNQREYTWDKKEWKELWIDINDTIEFKNNQFNKKEYFIGSCLFQKQSSEKELSIIDGQQRLTTFLIILSVLYDLFYELGEKGLLNIYNLYICKTDDNGNPFFTLYNEDIYPFFDETILHKGENKSFIEPRTKQEEKLQKCYQFFHENLQEKMKSFDDTYKIEYLKFFRDQLLNLKIIEIIVLNDELQSHTIFEILNARGKQLELPDRMKNLVLKKLPITFPSDRAKLTWAQIRNNITTISSSEKSLTNFINHYWISTYQKLKSEDDLYHDFKVNITSDNVQSFIDDLKEKSEIYINLAKPQETNLINNKIFNSIEGLVIFDTIQPRPLLLSLFHQYQNNTISDKDLTKIIRKIENFHFIFSAISSETPNKYEKIYHEYSPKIRNSYNKHVVNDFLDALREKLPKYEQFKENFILTGYSRKNKKYKSKDYKKLVQYILHEFEIYYNNTDELKINQITIEHIQGDDGNDETAFIGNLLPLSGKLNENSEDFLLSKKIQYYEQSELKSVKEFLKHHKDKKLWTEKDINERSERMAHIAYNEIWKV